MRVFKFLCVPASAADDRVLRDQVFLGARYRRQIALIENRERALQRAILALVSTGPMETHEGTGKNSSNRCEILRWSRP